MDDGDRSDCGINCVTTVHIVYDGADGGILSGG